jgi:dTDP-4-dehydrorhamnose 3,5-epimerase
VRFHQTKIQGVFEVHPEPRIDDRGSFARTWCQKEFEAHGLNPKLVQCSVSLNTRKGTLRGLHYQAAPYPEAKLVRCTKGSIFDVVVDLRPDSPTYQKWISVVLTSSGQNMIYVPEGCAHGFLTQEDDSEVFYQMSEFYHPELARGVRWDDPSFQIVWPGEIAVISERDRAYENFEQLPCAC